jgi:hypothetical protein
MAQLKDLGRSQYLSAPARFIDCQDNWQTGGKHETPKSCGFGPLNKFQLKQQPLVQSL